MWALFIVFVPRAVLSRTDNNPRLHNNSGYDRFQLSLLNYIDYLVNVMPVSAKNTKYLIFSTSNNDSD